VCALSWHHGGEHRHLASDGSRVVSTQVQLGRVLFGVEREGTHWQQVAAGLDGWHVINATSCENEEKRQRLRLRAQAARDGSAET
jgi:hypothetical protein